MVGVRCEVDGLIWTDGVGIYIDHCPDRYIVVDSHTSCHGGVFSTIINKLHRDCVST